MRYLTILAAFLSLIACGEEEKKPVYTIVNGQLPAGTEEIMATGYEHRRVALNEQGTFSDTLDIIEAQYMTYYNRGNNVAIYVEPGDEISFEISEDGELPTFSETRQVANQYLAQKAAIEEETTGDYRQLFSMDEGAFKSLIDSTYAVIGAKLASTSASDKFKQLEAENLKYNKLRNFAQYKTYHPGLVQEYESSGTFEAMFEDFDFNNEVYAKRYIDYAGIASMVLEDEIYAEPEDGEEEINYLDRSLNVLQKVESPTILHNQLRGALYYFNSQSEDLEADRDRLLALAKLDITKDAINERYTLLNKLMAGKPSPDFNYENYKGGETSLEDLRGKYVYVDVWATWCGPCLGEIPSLKAMEKTYHDANVEFVSISIDEKDDYEKWRTMIEKRELGGTQLMSDKNWQSDFVKGYGIQGIPHFVLIDPEGNIVSADAPRPSDEKLTEQFEALGL